MSLSTIQRRLEDQTDAVHSLTDLGSKSSLGSMARVDVALRELLQSDEKGCKALFGGSPLTSSGKFKQMIRMVLLTMVPIIALICLAINDLTTTLRENEEAYLVRQTITFSRDIGNLLHRLQNERDMTALHISTLGPVTKQFLSDTYPETDQVLDDMDYWPVQPDESLQQFQTKINFQRYLDDHRVYLDGSNSTLYDEVDFYTNTIKVFIGWLYESISQSSGRDGIWRQLVSYQLMTISKEDIGVERTLGGVFFAVGGFRRYDDYLWYIEKWAKGNGNFEAAVKYEENILSLYEEYLDNMDSSVAENVKEMRSTIRRNSKLNVASWLFGSQWFSNMSIFMEVLLNIQDNLADKIVAELESQVEDDLSQIGLSIGILVFVLLMCPLILNSVYNLTDSIQKYAITLVDQTERLQKERKRNDSLLFQMLPETVAETLKKNRDVLAETFEECTVFFSDVVGFSKICAESSPVQVVRMLNNLYVMFDMRIELYDVYKVETIGDSYMVASGVPRRNGKCHAGEIATMALDLLHHISVMDIPHLPGVRMKLRIGMHSGPVVAGVVGSKCPRYCLFGDTVNIASRMESNGGDSRIHLTEATYFALNHLGGYHMVKRGNISIKGKGSMPTFWLERKEGLEYTAEAELLNDPALDEDTESAHARTFMTPQPKHDASDGNDQLRSSSANPNEKSDERAPSEY